MKLSDRRFRLCLWKAYFDKGVGLMQYPKLFLAAGALATLNVRIIALVAASFAVVCFALGWAWYHYGWIYAENEVSNRFNYFVKEMRSKHGKK